MILATHKKISQVQFKNKIKTIDLFIVLLRNERTSYIKRKK